MKKLQEKILSLIPLLKGKKPVVIIGSVLVIIACFFGVKYGYITEDMIDFHLIVNEMDNLFGSSATDSIPHVDTLSNLVDTTKIVVDSLAN